MDSLTSDLRNKLRRLEDAKVMKDSVRLQTSNAEYLAAKVRYEKWLRSGEAKLLFEAIKTAYHDAYWAYMELIDGTFAFQRDDEQKQTVADAELKCTLALLELNKVKGEHPEYDWEGA